MLNYHRKLGVLLVLVSLLAGCQGGTRSAHEEPTPTPIPTPIVPEKPTYVVQRGEVVRKLEFTARVAPVQEAKLFFRTNGYVRAVFVEKGDMVKEGDILAELEMAELERSLAKARLDLQTAQLQLAQAEQDHQEALARARLKLQTAQTNLAAAEAERTHALARARIDLAIKRLQLQKAQAQDLTPRKAQAEANLERARIALQQAQAAYDEIAWRGDVGATPQAAALQQATLDFQQAQAAYDLAVQEIEAQRYELEILKQQVALAELELKRLQEGETDPQLQQAVALAQLELEALERGIDPQLRQAVAAAQLEVDHLEAQVAEARLVAPFDGEVVSISAYPGRAAEAFKPVCIVADLRALEVSAELTGEQMRELTEGQAVTLVPVDYPGQELAGTIRRLPYPYGGGGTTEALEQADKSTRISVDFTGLPPEMKLEMGDLVKVTVVLERKEDVLWLPPAAIRTFGGRKFVIVQEGARQRRVDVTLGIESKERVEIKSGLEEGQIVVGQ